MISEVVNVGSTSTSNPSTPNAKFNPFASNENSPQNPNSTVEIVPKGACFWCKKTGHWIKDCPDRSNKKIIERERINTYSKWPTIECPRCLEACSPKTSQTKQNPSRKFYTCFKKECNFFKWCDEFNFGAMMSIPLSSCPICACGAEVCQILTMREGPHAGRKYFACPIRKGQGACNFFQWVDTQTETTLNGPVDKRRDPVSPDSVLNSDVPDHVNSVDIESQEMNVHLQCSDVNMSGTPECNVVVRKRKRQSDYAPVSDFSVIPRINVRNESCVPDQAEEHRLVPHEMSTDILKVDSPNFFVTAREETQQNEDLSMDVSLAGTASVGDAVTIGLHVKGLWGQLVFSPLRCLTVPPTKTFFCRTLPSLPSNMPLVNDLEEFNSQPSDFQPSCPGSPDDAQEDNLNDFIRKAFSQAALKVQSKLLCQLEFMDPLEHATMELKANIAFSALNSLGINYGPFAEHVREFVCSAKSLAEIDASICREDASERLEHEKVCRDNLSHAHAEITNELRTSREEVQSLCEEENRLRNKLLQIETQRTQYEDKARSLEHRLVKISEEISESECRLQAVTLEFEKAMKFQQLREMEQNAMKKSSKNARAHLTGMPIM